MVEHKKHVEKETVVLADIDNDEHKKASLMVQRPNGNIVRASLYDRNGIDTNWIIGAEYELRNIELNLRTDGGRFLTSDGGFSVKKTGECSDFDFDFLILGDTHFGYRNRSRNMDTRYTNGYELNVLDRIIQFSDSWGVDAVLHTGDLFDHKINARDYKKVESSFRRLGEMDVDILFVTGNHDQEVINKIRSINELSNVKRLDDKSNWGTVSGNNVMGRGSNDFYSLSDFDWQKFEEEYGGPNIFLAHPEGLDPDSSTFSELPEKIDKRWTMFFGHHHEEKEVWGSNLSNLRAIYTGFPAKLDDGGSVWRLQGGNGFHRITSHSLKKAD